MLTHQLHSKKRPDPFICLTPGSLLPQILTTTSVVDGYGRFKSQVDPDGRTSSAAYSFSGGRTTVDSTDRNGVTTQQLYDGASQLRTIVSPAGDQTQFKYTLAGRLDEEVLQEMTTGLTDIRKSKYGYDDLGRSNSQKYFDNIASGTFIEWTNSYTFGPTGREVTSVDPRGNQTVTDYDSTGAVTRVTQPDPLTGPGGAPHGTPITEFAYSFVGLPGATVNSVTTIDPLGRETRTVSNNLGWMLEGFDADGVRQMASDYDLAGRVIKQTDALGQYTQTEYFLASGLPKNVSVPVAAAAAVGGKTEYEYDSSGNMVKLTDSAGNTTEWEYDEISRRTTETVTVPTFDVDGNVNGTQTASRNWLYNQLITDYTDRNGRSINYVVAPTTRTSTETWDDGRVITFTSNAAGQLVEAMDVAGVETWLRTYDYNDLGWLLDESFELNDGGVTFYQTSAVSAYTDTGVRNDLSYSLGGTEQIHQVSEVDGLDRVWQVTQSSASGGFDLDVQFTYRADSSIDTLQRSETLGGVPIFNVSQTDYDYFANGDLKTIDHGASIARYDYEYDDLRRITKITSADWPTGNVINYDAQSQLTSASETNESFTYDDNGNRINSGYTTAEHNLLVEDADYRYVYDAEGNRTRRIDKATGESVEYEWDYRNRLILIVFKDSTGTATKRIGYDYNLDNLRIAKEVHTTTPDGTGTPDSIQRFAYDGGNVVLVFDGQNGNSVEHRYFHGPGVDQIFADEDALGEVLWALTDHQGSVRDWIDETGSIEHHTQFDSFGNIVAPADPSTVPTYAFTGREWDADAEMYYYRARWYDPAIGKFVGDDPSGFDAGDSNLQRYVGNNAANSLDPSGLEKVMVDDSGVVWVVPESWWFGIDYDDSKVRVGRLIQYTPDAVFSDKKVNAVHDLILTDRTYTDVNGEEQPIILHFGHFDNHVRSYDFINYRKDHFEAYADEEGFSLNKTRNQVRFSQGFAKVQLRNYVSRYQLYDGYGDFSDDVIDMAVGHAIGLGAIGGTFRYIRGARNDIALGMRLRHGGKLEQFAVQVGAADHTRWKILGLYDDGVNGWGRAFMQAMNRTRAAGGRAHFDLAVVNLGTAKAGNPASWQDSFTAFELRSILRRPDWFKMTDFYINGQKLTSKQMQELGIVLHSFK